MSAEAQEWRAVLARHGRSFHLAGRLLPQQALDEAALLYAFCRLVDDVADEAPSPEEALRGLDGLEAEWRGQAAPRPLVRAMRELAARRALPEEAILGLFAGVRSDLGPVRLPDDAALRLYCWQVAGTVGLLMSPILGVTEPAARHYAETLGMAMQLTNICRDVAEDARRGRVYLPAERLRRAGLSPEALLAGPVSGEALSSVVRQLLAEADQLYAQGIWGARYIPLPQRMAITAAARIYQAIGHRLLSVHGGDPQHGRTVVPGAHKLLQLMRGLWEALSPPALPALPLVSP